MTYYARPKTVASRPQCGSGWVTGNIRRIDIFKSEATGGNRINIGRSISVIPIATEMITAQAVHINVEDIFHGLILIYVASPPKNGGLAVHYLAAVNSSPK